MRHDLQRHVFESTGRPVPKLQNVPSPNLRQRNRIRVIEFIGCISYGRTFAQFFRRIIRKNCGQYCCRKFNISATHPSRDRQYRQSQRNKQAAIHGNPAADRLRAGNRRSASTRTNVIHRTTTPFPLLPLESHQLHRHCNGSGFPRSIRGFGTNPSRRFRCLQIPPTAGSLSPTIPQSVSNRK